ncbi:hypothetical protein DEJ16_01710 [Curtobacterium sp. MCJR17_055]|nr:hypothetical protein DEJ26_10400 [Curtobacterium sp. MCPF17_015]PYY58438.1 hypothetical protein DEJ16_01710 [Curtobacterium sp. MCJR17_055]
MQERDGVAVLLDRVEPAVRTGRAAVDDLDGVGVRRDVDLVREDVGRGRQGQGDVDGVADRHRGRCGDRGRGRDRGRGGRCRREDGEADTSRGDDGRAECGGQAGGRAGAEPSAVLHPCGSFVGVRAERLLSARTVTTGCFALGPRRFPTCYTFGAGCRCHWHAVMRHGDRTRRRALGGPPGRRGPGTDRATGQTDVYGVVSSVGALQRTHLTRAHRPSRTDPPGSHSSETTAPRPASMHVECRRARPRSCGRRDHGVRPAPRDAERLKKDSTMTTNEHTIITGTAIAAPTVSPDRIAEFPVREDRSQREYLVRMPADDLGLFLTPGVRVSVDGEAGWVVPGRSWRGEASRTILQARAVRAPELALAA